MKSTINLFRLWAHDANHGYWEIFHYCLCSYWIATHNGSFSSLCSETRRAHVKADLHFRIQMKMLWISTIKFLRQIHSFSYSHVGILDIYHDHSSFYILGYWVSWMGFDGCVLLCIYKCDHYWFRWFGPRRSSRT